MIIHKMSGVKNPSEKIIKTCHTNNKDGFGVMWRDGDSVRIFKGLYDLQTINKIISKVPTDCEAAYHFRQATHGGVAAQNCHPFPLVDRLDALRATKGTFDSGVVHNGVIHDFGDSKSSVSDTMNFIRYLARTKKYGFDRLKKHIPTKYGKFIVFTPLYTYTFGSFNEDNDLRYSSYSYRDYEKIWGVNNPNNNYTKAIEQDKDGFRGTLDTFPIIKEVEYSKLRFLGNCGRRDCTVSYKDVYGTYMLYKGKYIFIEDGATKEDVAFALLDIDCDDLEDGIPVNKALLDVRL